MKLLEFCCIIKSIINPIRLKRFICVFSVHISVEEAQRYLRCKRGHAGDEGREPADDEREESDHSGTVSLSPLPSASPHCHHPAVISAALWHQCCECVGRK